MEEEIRQEVEAKVDNLTLMSMTMATEKRTMTTTVENRTMIIIKV